MINLTVFVASLISFCFGFVLGGFFKLDSSKDNSQSKDFKDVDKLINEIDDILNKEEK
jgi:hypothetical protein